MLQNNKTKEELENQIKSLKSELLAYQERESLGLSSSENGIKKILKNTTIYKVALNANSPLGKVIRFPRTALRIAEHPETLNYIQDASKKSKIPLFYPIEFYMGEYNEKRINLVLENYNEILIRQAFEFAHNNDSELRVILVSNNINLTKIQAFLKNLNNKNQILITYYDSGSQRNSGQKTFKLEIGKQDLFITKAWSKNA